MYHDTLMHITNATQHHNPNTPTDDNHPLMSDFARRPKNYQLIVDDDVAFEVLVVMGEIKQDLVCIVTIEIHNHNESTYSLSCVKSSRISKYVLVHYLIT